jgi:endonuclease/exonuclease/phosphatase (EEP) superfamily protein YafD
MNRRHANDGPQADSAVEFGYSQVAALAAKLTALPPHDSLPADGTQKAVPRRRARPLSRWALIVISFAWFITLGLASIAALHVFFHDQTNVLIWLNAFTRYLYLPAYACLTLAIWKRRLWLAFANLAIIGCHLFWIAPDFMRDRRFDAEPANAAAAEKNPANSVRIFFANVYYQNQDFTALLHEIEDADPDVIVLVEFPWSWRDVFLKSPVIAKYRYGHGFKPWRYDSVILYSKLPVQNESESRIADRTVQSADIRIGSRILHLIGLHAPRPMHFHDNDYDGYWQQVLPRLLGAPHPLVAIGDFNATQYSLVYERLKAGGLRSAHEDRGRGYATTWPNGMDPVPPIRIDQAFLSPDVVCQGIAEGEGRGSDHKPLILDVRLGAKR